VARSTPDLAGGAYDAPVLQTLPLRVCLSAQSEKSAPMTETSVDDLSQDSMNPGKQMIIIRSLVPDGMAQHDGRLEPGDRLISVNGINVFNATLEEAVQALKGAPRGVVTLQVLKPAHFGESSTDPLSDAGVIRDEVILFRTAPGLFCNLLCLCHH